ncbi:hypothetical protein A4X13_0g5323 [Tilletia indica]|uniref:Uncharacterized protein n=1 Tax=Tilletia indica TaxID=43049 RepID=A0A177T6S3_9BASI|nr:hypothetical protein A4X13_0g5323 [Tilletia indica]
MDAGTEPHVSVVHTAGLTRVLHAPASAGVDRLFTAGNDYLVRLLPTSHQSSQEARLIEDAQGPITWIDADKENLVIGSQDGCVRVYNHKGANVDDAEGGHLETQAAQPTDLVQILTRTSLPVRCVAIERAPQGGASKARVAVCSDELTIKVVSLNDPTQVSLLTEHTRPLRAAAWSPRSALLVTTSCDGTARIWDLSSPEAACIGKIENTLARLTVESELASLPLWHPSGKYFLLPSKTNEFSIVTCTGGTWAVTGKFSPPSEDDAALAGTGDITYLAFSPNGRYLAAATTDNQVTIWETTPGNRKPIGSKKAESNVTGISWHPSKDALAWADNEGNLIRWDGVVGADNPNPFEQVAFGMGVSASKATGRSAIAARKDAAPSRSREPDEIDDLFFGAGIDGDNDMDVDGNADVGKGLLAHEAGHDGDASDDEDEDALDRDDDNDMDDFLVDDDDGGAAADAVGLAASAYARELAQERQSKKSQGSRAHHSGGHVSGLSGVSVKSQLPFQPTSTPMRDQRRYLAFNMLGSLMAIDQGTHQTVQFESHDTSARRNFRMVDYHRFSLGALAFHGALLGVPASAAAESTEDVESGLSSVTYRPFEQAWGGAAGEWTVNLPQGESVELIALGGPAPQNSRRDDLEEDEAANTRCAAAVVATSAGYLRFFSATGMQRYIWSYGKPVVSIAAGVRSVLIVYRGAGSALDEWQNLHYDLVDLDSFQVRHTGSLPLARGRALRWIGFNEWDVPAMYDSTGLLNVLDGAHKPAAYIPRWTPVLETANLTLTPPGDEAVGDVSKGKSKINYWPVGLSSTHMMCLMLKGSALPDPHGLRPLIQDVELKMPVLNPEAPSAALEEKWMRQTLLAGLTRDAIRSGMTAALTSLTSVSPPEALKLEQDADKDLLQLIQLACKGDRHGRALDAARELHSVRTLDAALSIAGFFHLPSLAERMGSLREEVERRSFEREGAGISELEREWEMELEMRRKWATHGLGDVNLPGSIGGGSNDFGSGLLVPSTQDGASGRRAPTAAAASKALTEGFAPRSALSKGARRSIGRSASVTFSPMVEEQQDLSSAGEMNSWTDASLDAGNSYDFDADEEERSGALELNDTADSFADDPESSPRLTRGEKRKSPVDDSDTDMPPPKAAPKKTGSNNPFSASNKSARANNPFARTASNVSTAARGPDRQMHKTTSFFDRVEAKGAVKKPKQQTQRTLFDMVGGKQKTITPATKSKQTKAIYVEVDDGEESTSPNGKVPGKVTSSHGAVDALDDDEDDDFDLPTPSFATRTMLADAGAEDEVRSTLEAAERKSGALPGLEETQYSTEETQAQTQSQGVDIEQFRMRA